MQHQQGVSNVRKSGIDKRDPENHNACFIMHLSIQKSGTTRAINDKRGTHKGGSPGCRNRSSETSPAMAAG
jgi:hypothetical protein